MGHKHGEDCTTHMEILLTKVRDMLVLGHGFPAAIHQAALQARSIGEEDDVVDIIQVLLEALSDEIPLSEQKDVPENMWALEVWDQVKGRKQSARIDLVMKAVRKSREMHKLLHQNVDEVVQRALDIVNGKIKPGEVCPSSSKPSS